MEVLFIIMLGSTILLSQIMEQQEHLVNWTNSLNRIPTKFKIYIENTS
jgi:hypothetical protein